MKETFGQRLARLRKQKGLTQEEIANRVNISPQAVSKWENDISSPDIDTIVKLSEILNVSLNELLGKEETTPVVLEEENKKDINKMLLKIKVLSNDGDKINVNLPMGIIKICLDNNVGIPQINGNKAFSEIDFHQVLDLVEKGVIGEIISVESRDGDHISVVVE